MYEQGKKVCTQQSSCGLMLFVFVCLQKSGSTLKWLSQENYRGQLLTAGDKAEKT